MTDDPKLSSAALCIELRLALNDEDNDDDDASPTTRTTFRPEFTHQCFPGEFIRGYQPHQDLIPKDLVHKSYQHHDEVNTELSVLVLLAPSGRYCNVNVKTRKKRFLRQRRVGSPVKRVKVDTEQQQQEEEEAIIRENDSDDSTNQDESEASFHASDATAEEDEEEVSDFSSADFEESDNDDENLNDDGLDPQGETRHRRMSPAEIVHCLRKALPDVKRRGNIKDEYLSAPLGVVLRTYQRKGAEFCISLASGREAAKYHSSVQRLALLFIENADDVQVDAQDGGGYWKVVYVFRIHGPKKFSLAGYVTLFHFSAPFRKPKAGTIVRICQAVVLPPYQRAGHGREMLHTVHDLAQEKFNDKITKYGEAIVEINVEDPAPGFVALRNLVDYERYAAVKASSEPDWFKDLCHDVNDDAYFDLLPESIASELSLKSKMTVTQMQIIYELDRLVGLARAGAKELDKYEKNYRLMVKKRLNRDNKEDLSMCRNKEAMKHMLEELYQEQRAIYDKYLPKIK